MSFLYRAVPVARTAIRPSTRLFSTTVIQRQIIGDGVKDAVKKPFKAVDDAVSPTLVKGLDKVEELKNKASSVAGANADEAKGKAQELAGEAQGKAAELKGEAKGKAAEIKGEAKSKL